MAETASKATGQPTPVPTNKVVAGSISGAVVIIVVYVLNTYVLGNNKLPAEVSSAITVVVSFVASYFARPSSDQTSVVAGDGGRLAEAQVAQARVAA